MYYITLDLEWNQAYRQQLLAVQKRISQRLLGEVMQIGAVKLDESLSPCGSFQIIVRPRFFRKIHRHVRDLTHITQEMMDRGTTLQDAGERFRRWCGEDFAFLTWGPDDIPMLKDNFRANKMDGSWLDNTYDLQRIFNMQTDGQSKQRSLEYAMEHFGIPQNLPPHDALNDAYFTALVAARLDVKGGIEALRSGERRHEGDVTEEYGNADAGDEGFESIDEALSDAEIISHACPICGSALSQEGKFLHSRGQKYTVPLKCEKDGAIMLRMKLHRNFDETWRAKCTYSAADEESLAAYEKGMAEARNRRKTGKRAQRPRQRRQTSAESETAGAGTES